MEPLICMTLYVSKCCEKAKDTNEIIKPVQPTVLTFIFCFHLAESYLNSF